MILVAAIALPLVSGALLPALKLKQGARLGYMLGVTLVTSALVGVLLFKPEVERLNLIRLNDFLVVSLHLDGMGKVFAALVAYGLVLLVIFLLPLANKRELMAVLPLATLSCAVLGPMLITSSQHYTFAQTIGFAVGSGLGYGLAVIMLSEGQRKMNNRKVPATFKGLPINLIYIGILALAIFGLTGHMVSY